MFAKYLSRRCSTALIKIVEKGQKECKFKEPKEISYCNVAIIGADSRLGELSAFVMKQNPLITTLHLQGGTGVEGLKEDLSHIDTSCKVVAHSVLLGMGGFSPRTPLGDRVMAEGNRICKLAEHCTKYARRAIIVVCATPVSVMMPLVADIFRRTHWYHPARILGFTGPISIVVNTEVGHHQCFDPNIVDVPLTGGPDLESIVPVFSKSNPCPVDPDSAIELTGRLRGIDPKDFPKRVHLGNTFVKAIYPEAIALNRLVSAIAYGIHGDEQAIGYAHVRTNLVKSCRFMVSLVKFGPQGILHNYGIPQLSKFEQDLLERGLTLVSYKEEMACEYLEYYLSKRRDVLPPFKQKEVEEFQEKRKSVMRN